ncbi:hypothetical protein PLESTB_001539200 [Pleodorina starrii]|uniref:CN hydrolase domain-containing protein n=1 Tax=Pleodorina starrii TaxID=330485 RepID=A0A9W6F838_9CHLO|nr:hypothetical protein PLESTM_001844400 [Pleodorina starrii]GLC59819.1 hypothetical protein PLESTB_001539200 [Pleodorina starrii]GLC67297.1 hypothetical protein PLESTF_000539600 [Pleodorina starrii]
MVRKVVLAATQFACSEDKKANADKAEQLVRQAAAAGAQIILLQELFEGLYWCQVQEKEYFSWSAPFEGHPLISRFAQLARELRVVLPVPFFERANNAYFNSVAMVDADGSVLGRYRKSHIPDGPGYQEKFYFNPGDTGFRVFDTAYGKVGIAICWDQWFPEAARALALQGAEVLLYPTAIGSEPQDPSINSYPHWIRVQQGHAGSNLLPLVASNRIGTEQLPGASPTTFYGGSFIAGHQGQILAQVGATSSSTSSTSLELSLPGGNPHPAPAPLEGFVTAEVDLDLIAAERAAWGVFRDRRPELYGPLATLGGSSPPGF